MQTDSSEILFEKNVPLTADEIIFVEELITETKSLKGPFTARVCAIAIAIIAAGMTLVFWLFNCKASDIQFYSFMIGCIVTAILIANIIFRSHLEKTLVNLRRDVKEGKNKLEGILETRSYDTLPHFFVMSTAQKIKILIKVSYKDYVFYKDRSQLVITYLPYSGQALQISSQHKG